MRLRALSGFGEKGPACFLLEIHGRRILLDLGRGPDGDALPDLAGVAPVDAIVFSHGHADHTGGLHLATDLGNPPLYAPGPSILLAPDPALKEARPLEALREILGLPFCSGPAGHAPGASWIRIGGRDGLLYTGDLSEESLLWRCTMPPRARVLLADASYGAADEPLSPQIGQMLALTDGPLLLPAPAGGRGLEMATAFQTAGHAVRLCPAHRAVAGAMLEAVPWLAPGGAAALRRLLAESGPLDEDSAAGGVMVAAGPNAERGVAGALAPRFIAEGSARVVFTGHLSGGTPAPEWVACGKAQFRRWNVHPTLSGLKAVVAAADPERVMPAFCTAAMRDDLALLIDRPVVTEPEITW
ncbi:MBL fold metallo-hydrolase [Plastorhodobacter daqingensis]|uniref:MBL fold metallo-hydrolase n=1 Tax=Plastorhodobacter daqingensis TaxID=1387281 RepID=A0ABW2UJY4_9RHOB